MSWLKSIIDWWAQPSSQCTSVQHLASAWVTLIELVQICKWHLIWASLHNYEQWTMKKLWNENGPPLCKCGWYAHLCWHQYCLTKKCTAQDRLPACYLCTQPHLLHPPEASTFITLYGNTLKVSHYATQEQPCHRRLSTIWLWRGGRGQYPPSGKNTQNSIWNAL